MQGITKTVTIFEEEMEMEVLDGEIEGGEVKANSIQVTTESGESDSINFNDPVAWTDVENEAKEYLALSRLNQLRNGDGDGGLPDPDLDGWVDPKVLTDPRASSQKEILETIAFHGPVTTSAVDELTDAASSSISNMVLKLKEKGLVECIGHKGGAQIMYATPVGMKEALAIAGDPEMETQNVEETEAGVDSLF